ncbi:MAG TPA: M10 family metallopeptidase C-terminal domain-containing protein [Allosphingosinicella sp.]|nr:M10 family metallopeptidase C-terminal domain-containing protein [Allosphingosinicella sp.]
MSSFWFGKWAEQVSDLFAGALLPFNATDGDAGTQAAFALLLQQPDPFAPAPAADAASAGGGTGTAETGIAALTAIAADAASTPEPAPPHILSIFPAGPLGDNESDPSVAAASFVTSSGEHIAFMSDDPAMGIGGGLFIDTDNRTILTDGDLNQMSIGGGPDDTLVLAGAMGAMSLAGYGDMFERVQLMGGTDYDLTTVDGNVDAGHRLTVSADMLGAANHLDFDGSAETDGSFQLFGGAGDDHLIGGHGADMISGGAGADILTGGGGADTFFYLSPAESTGAHYDTITDFTFGEDVIDLPVTVTGLDAAVNTGTLSQDSFDTDLAAALGANVLEAGHALFFTPDSGSLAGQHFLIVDANGEAGYQAGQDYVIHINTLPPADFHGTGFLV